jgi:hypothetical protein
VAYWRAKRTFAKPHTSVERHRSDIGEQRLN